MNRVTYFELGTSNPEKTADFYRAVFGWQINKWSGPMDYWQVDAGAGVTDAGVTDAGAGGAGAGGINGGLMLSGGDFKGTVVTVEVDDIDACIAKALANGGEIALEKQAIPGIGYQAYIKDNSGILVGLHKIDPSAGKGG